MDCFASLAMTGSEFSHCWNWGAPSYELVESRRCRLAIRRRELNRTLGIGGEGRDRRSAQAALFRRCERDAFGLSSQLENGDALEPFRINRLVFLADEEDFNRRIFCDEFHVVRAGID